MLANFRCKGCSIDIACSTDYYVLSDVEIVVELFDLFRGNGEDNVLDTVRGLTDKMILTKTSYTLKAV